MAASAAPGKGSDPLPATAAPPQHSPPPLAGGGRGEGAVERHRRPDQAALPPPRRATPEQQRPTSAWRRLQHIARIRVQIQRRNVVRRIEIEHPHNGPSRRVERPTAEALALQPVVLDESHHRSQRDARMINMIWPSPRRDHQERNACARTAAPINRLARDTRRRCAAPAFARAVELIGLRIK
jgi:hypothetical protein